MGLVLFPVGPREALNPTWSNSSDSLILWFNNATSLRETQETFKGFLEINFIFACLEWLHS